MKHYNKLGQRTRRKKKKDVTTLEGDKCLPNLGGQKSSSNTAKPLQCITHHVER